MPLRKTPFASAAAAPKKEAKAEAGGGSDGDSDNPKAKRRRVELRKKQLSSLFADEDSDGGDARPDAPSPPGSDDDALTPSLAEKPVARARAPTRRRSELLGGGGGAAAVRTPTEDRPAAKRRNASSRSSQGFDSQGSMQSSEDLGDLAVGVSQGHDKVLHLLTEELLPAVRLSARCEGAVQMVQAICDQTRSRQDSFRHHIPAIFDRLGGDEAGWSADELSDEATFNKAACLCFARVLSDSVSDDHITDACVRKVLSALAALASQRKVTAAAAEPSSDDSLVVAPLRRQSSDRRQAGASEFDLGVDSQDFAPLLRQRSHRQPQTPSSPQTPEDRFTTLSMQEGEIYEAVAAASPACGAAADCRSWSLPALLLHALAGHTLRSDRILRRNAEEEQRGQRQRRTFSRQRSRVSQEEEAFTRVQLHGDTPPSVAVLLAADAGDTLRSMCDAAAGAPAAALRDGSAEAALCVLRQLALYQESARELGQDIPSTVARLLVAASDSMRQSGPPLLAKQRRVVFLCQTVLLNLVHSRGGDCNLDTKSVKGLFRHIAGDVEQLLFKLAGTAAGDGEELGVDRHDAVSVGVTLLLEVLRRMDSGFEVISKMRGAVGMIAEGWRELRQHSDAEHQVAAAYLAQLLGGLLLHPGRAVAETEIRKRLGGDDAVSAVTSSLTEFFNWQVKHKVITQESAQHLVVLIDKLQALSKSREK